MSPRLPILGPLARATLWAGAFACTISFAGGCAKPVVEGVVRRDSAGVEIVTIPKSVMDAAPVWSVDTATHLWTIGGGEDPAMDIDRMSSIGRMANGDVVVGVTRPGELRIYPAAGGAPRVIARGGEGPGEFRTPYLLGIRGDTLILWDYSLNRVTTLTTEGTLVQVVNHAAQPRHRLREIAGMLDDGRIVTSGQTWEAMAEVGDQGVRTEQPIYFLHADGTSADSLQGPPGMLVYKGIVYEGGKSFSSVTTYQLDNRALVFARGAGYTTAPPGEPEYREYDATGALRRIVRPHIATREVTPAFREEYIAHDSIEFVKQNPQLAPEWIRNYREGRFVDRLAAFEQVRGAPDGELWFERSWVQYDPVKEFVVFDSTGMVAGTVTIPMSRTIGWIGKDAVLATWRDDDDVRHLSLYPLHRASE